MASLDYTTLGFKDILVHLDGPVAVVTLNRAKQPIFQEDGVCCSVKNLNARENMGWRREVAMAIFRCRKITIAAVNGHAVGVGVTGLQLPCDFRFVWAGAKLAFPFVRRGIAAEATSSYLLPKLLGHARATALFLTGATVSPDSPHIAGLYHTILPMREEVFPAALAFAQELAANTSQTAVAVTKALLWRGADNIEEQHLIDSRAIKILGSSADAEEGARAFKERRPVKFTDTLSNLAPWMPWWREIDVRHRKAKL
ncbi:putative enoyl-CoA hydratase echA12 [Grifola frondosa]|uniref:Putative enoyl-CoA hydratase echA12 n=1 Tax=Grifola frondosa TaxID=5627 RepID=A0A1C7LNB3_GRIFR|nr:putative enoyl-CoA hydratase echA12 [Grifola frondosa]